MKRSTFSFTILVTLMAQGLFALPMKVTDADENYGGRLWIPCSFGHCMLDTAGRGSMVTVDNLSIALR